MVKLQSVLGSPKGPPRSGWGVLSLSIVNLWFLSGKGRSRHPCFFPSFLSLSRCQHLKVNNIQEGSGVRAASGLSRSPQTEPVRAWIWPVWCAERSWATAAPWLDTMSSARAVTVMEKRGCLLNPGFSVGMQTLCRRAHVVEAPPVKGRQTLCRGLSVQPNEPVIPHWKFMGEGRRRRGGGGLGWLTGLCPGVSRLGTTGTSYQQSHL